MSEYELYVHRVVRNLRVGMDSVAGEYAIAAELCRRHDEGKLRKGLRQLRGLLTRLYADMGANPAEYGIPPIPDSKVHHTASRRKVRTPFEAPLKVLYALGVGGGLLPADGGDNLVAVEDHFREICASLGLPDPEQAIAGLRRVGFTVERGETIRAVRASEVGRALTGLCAFAQTCQLWERDKLKSRQMPQVFLLADYRILRRIDRRARLPKLTTDDVMPFVPAEHTDDLRALCAHVEGLGYHADVERAHILDGEWHVHFAGTDHGKRVFGFTACRGCLWVHLSCNDRMPILPHVEQSPPAFRNELLRHGCHRCGDGGCGKHVTVLLDGKDHEICYGGPLWVERWQPAFLEPMKHLITLQDGIVRGAGK